MYKLTILLVIVPLVFVIYLAFQARLSLGGGAPGVADGKLAPCPDSPNCVCSEYRGGGEHFIPPLKLEAAPEAELARLLRIIDQLGGSIDSARGDYVAASFASPLFGFVDDVELRVDRAAGVIHVRSASRVGYSDLGANRDRIEKIRQRFDATRNSD